VPIYTSQLLSCHSSGVAFHKADDGHALSTTLEWLPLQCVRERIVIPRSIGFLKRHRRFIHRLITKLNWHIHILLIVLWIFGFYFLTMYHLYFQSLHGQAVKSKEEQNIIHWWCKGRGRYSGKVWGQEEWLACHVIAGSFTC
jgi:hypothetical protein